MKKFFLLAALSAGLTLFSQAEIILEGRKADQRYAGAELVRFKDGASQPNFVRFSEGKGPLLQEVSAWILSNFGLGEGFQLTIEKSHEDKIGFTHTKFSQFYNGMKVEFASIMVHSKFGRVHSINGYYSLNLPEASHALIEADALKRCLDHVNASTYKWELKGEEDHLKTELGNPEATYFPTGEKVLFPEKTSFISSRLIPCWKFDIYAHSPLYRAYVYIDAISGEILFENHRIKDVDTNCTANTSYSGLRNIVADYTSNSNFRLRESARGGGIRTYDMLNGTSYAAATDITSGINHFDDTLRMKYATDAHWGTEMVYDYYMSVHGRNSFDDNGAILRSYVHYDVNYANAFWDGQRMTYGDGNSSVTAMTTLDITGHEITHGVDEYTSDLVYSYESGALDESFADIFGNAIEAHYKPHATKNWLLGEEIGSPFRSMSNPKTYNDPDTYLGNNWYTGAGDNGGVHTNSGVQNHWFYLLSMGGSGSNDNSDVFSVTGIGINKAELIAYRNRATYLTSNSDYEDARFYAIQAALDLYGPCSQELASTVNAWYAVGVGPKYAPTVVSDFEANVTTLCNLPATVHFTNLSNYNALTFVWDFGDGLTSSSVNPQHSYAAAGTYNVELVAIGNAICGSDSEVKTNYIDVNPPSDIQAQPYTICEGYAAKISVNATNDAFWYSDLISDDPIYIGSPYISPPLFKDTTFYVANGLISNSYHIGPVDNTIGGGGSFAGYRYLEFDVYDKVTLKTVKVYSFNNSSRVIELRNDQGDVIESKTVTVGTGEHILTLDFNIDPGTNYQLGVSLATTSDFFRNSAGAIFPYTYAGLLSITGPGNAPPGYYYFFYDWVVKGSDCVGIRKPVDVTVDMDPDCIPYVGIEKGSYEVSVNIFPNPSHGDFQVVIEGGHESAYSFEMTDVRGGRIDLSKEIEVLREGREYRLSLSALPAGIYILHIRNGQFSEVRRLVIK